MGHSLVFLLENLFTGGLLWLTQSKGSDEFVDYSKWLYLCCVIGFAGMNMLHFLLERLLRERMFLKSRVLGRSFYCLILFVCMSIVGFGTQSVFAEVSGLSASTRMLLDMGIAYAIMHLFMDVFIRRVSHTVTGRMLKKDDGDDPDDDNDYFDDDMD